MFQHIELNITLWSENRFYTIFCVFIWYLSIIIIKKKASCFANKKQTSINMKPELSKHETSDKSLFGCI